MPRAPRVDYPGSWHHVFDRGRARQKIFFDDADRFLFFDCIGEAVEEYGFEVHAYSLMPNHFHLLVRSVHGNLSGSIRHLKALFAQQMNARHSLDGSLFKGRFKSKLVRNEAYLVYLLSYMHCNPLRANLITRIDVDGGWTSHRQYMDLEKPRKWLRREFFLGQVGGARGLEDMVLNLHRGVLMWPPGMDKDTGFVDWKKAELTGKAKSLGKPTERGCSMESVLEELSEITGVEAAELKQSKRGREGNPARRFAVWALRERSHLSQAQIGKQFGMTPSAVAKDLRKSHKGLALFDEWSAKWLERHREKFEILLPANSGSRNARLDKKAQ